MEVHLVHNNYNPAKMFCSSRQHNSFVEESKDQLFLPARRFPGMSGEYSTGHGDCSIYTCVKCEQYGGFTGVLHESYARVKIYT